MSGFGYLSSAVASWMKGESIDQFTIGKVVDTNDPDQVGRVRVRCGGWSDSLSTPMEDLPWAIPISPLAGVTSFGRRGATQDEIDGPVAYGMWNTPKIGSFVLVGCLDGNRSHRFYIGGIHPHLAAHTLPHGRYLWNEDLEEGLPEGPVATNEAPIEPLHRNMTQQFTKSGSYHADGTPEDPRRNLEYRTRGADMQAAAIHNRHVADQSDGPGSEYADHLPGEVTKVTQEDGSVREVLGAGYARDQHEPDDVYPSTGGVNYDAHNYSWTTPGFHSISMNDRADNCRIRMRTTAGHQIIMDDTNERMYISTAGGETWIEIDQVGNIDIFASKNISTHAGGDINFTSDKTIRLQSREGIHMRTDGEFRAHSVKDFHVRTEQNMRTHSKLSTFMQSDERFHVYSKGTLYISSSTANVDLSAAVCLHSTSGNETHIRSGSGMFLTGGPRIDLNGPVAEAAVPASIAAEKQSFVTTRVPDHEPWARSFMKAEATDQNASNYHELEYEYTSSLVGRGGRGEVYARNSFWHR